MSEFTRAQIKHFEAYENVRRWGAYNMFDQRARRATGLLPAQYSFVMNNFSELKEAAEKQAKKQA